MLAEVHLCRPEIKVKGQVHIRNLYIVFALENLLDLPERTVKKKKKKGRKEMMKVSLEKLERFLLEEFQNKITLLRNSFEADLCYFIACPPLQSIFLISH